MIGSQGFTRQENVASTTTPSPNPDTSIYPCVGMRMPQVPGSTSTVALCSSNPSAVISGGGGLGGLGGGGGLGDGGLGRGGGEGRGGGSGLGGGGEGGGGDGGGGLGAGLGLAATIRCMRVRSDPRLMLKPQKSPDVSLQTAHACNVTLSSFIADIVIDGEV